MTDKQLVLHLKRLRADIDKEVLARGNLATTINKRLEDALLRQDDLLNRCVDAGTNHEAQCKALMARVDALEDLIGGAGPEPADPVYDPNAETCDLSEEDAADLDDSEHDPDGSL